MNGIRRRSREACRTTLAVFAALAGLAAGAAPAPAGSGEPIMLPEQESPRQQALPTDSYVAEVIDSTFFVGPAEFFALDLPTRGEGIEATHIFGTVTATGPKRDIIVRLFSGVEYDRWLKKRGGPDAKPFWVSPKARVVTLDHDLPSGQAAVLLLDNGFSLRTPKRVHCQLQIQYRRLDGAAAPRATRTAPPAGTAAPADDVVPTPRSNEEEDTPPPPPPPPSDEGTN